MGKWLPIIVQFLLLLTTFLTVKSLMSFWIAVFVCFLSAALSYWYALSKDKPISAVIGVTIVSFSGFCIASLIALFATYASNEATVLESFQGLLKSTEYEKWGEGFLQSLNNYAKILYDGALPPVGIKEDLKDWPVDLFIFCGIIWAIELVCIFWLNINKNKV